MHDFSINFVNSASMVSNENEIPSARSSPPLGSSHPLLRHTWREHPVSPPNEKNNSKRWKVGLVPSTHWSLHSGFSPPVPTIWWTKDLSKALDELMSTKGGLTGSAGGASSSRPKKHVAYICGGKLQPVSYGCFHKWWYPQNAPKWSFLVGKPMVVGYHHFRKPPYHGGDLFCASKVCDVLLAIDLLPVASCSIINGPFCSWMKLRWDIITRLSSTEPTCFVHRRGAHEKNLQALALCGV